VPVVIHIAGKQGGHVLLEKGAVYLIKAGVHDDRGVGEPAKGVKKLVDVSLCLRCRVHVEPGAVDHFDGLPWLQWHVVG
jgi:hypothetical protein